MIPEYNNPVISCCEHRNDPPRRFFHLPGNITRNQIIVLVLQKQIIYGCLL